MPNPAAADREQLAEIDPYLGGGARVRLAMSLLAVVLIVSLLPLAAFSLMTTREMESTLVVAQQEQQMHLAASVAQRLDAFLDQAGREAGKISELLPPLSAAERGGPPPYMGQFLDETVVLVKFRPLAGTAAGAIKPELVAPIALQRALEQDAQTIREQWSAAAAAGARTPLLGGPFNLGPERMLAVTVSAPVQRRGELLGVFQEVALFQRVWEEAARAAPSPMRLFLLRADGEIAATAAGALETETARSVREREIVQQFLAARGRSRGARAYEASTPGGGRRRMLGSFAATSYGWGVFIEVDEELALAPVRRQRQLMSYGGALAAALAIAAALLLGAVISRPITRLAQISKRLADGDFSVEARASRVLELDVLAANFNRMARRLGELVERFRAAAREANDMFLGTIRALAEAIDEKDPYTKGHSVRVNRYAVIIGRYLGLSRDEMRALQISSLLHDIGKIGIDDAILKKPTTLSPEEFAVIRTHPERGAKIMGRIPQMKNIIPGLRFHHERYTGGGYPLGLRRAEIPLQARIIAVADIFDAMITERPYQRPFPVAEAVARINDMKSRQTDPQVVEAFNRAYEAGEFDDLLAGPAPAAPAPPAAATTEAVAAPAGQLARE